MISPVRSAWGFAIAVALMAASVLAYHAAARRDQSSQSLSSPGELAGELSQEEPETDAESSLEEIINSGSDERPLVRMRAAESLGRAVRRDESLADNEQAADCLIKLLTDDANDVRRVACDSARWFNSPEVMEALRNVLETDSVDTVRSSAARALIYASEADSRRAVLDVALEDRSGLVRSTALRAFAETEPDEAVPVLIGVLESPNTLDHPSAMVLLEGISLGRAWAYRISMHWPELVILLLLILTASVISSLKNRRKEPGPGTLQA
jgi:HEAT repeat protein